MLFFVLIILNFIFNFDLTWPKWIEICTFFLSSFYLPSPPNWGRPHHCHVRRLCGLQLWSQLSKWSSRTLRSPMVAKGNLTRNTLLYSLRTFHQGYLCTRIENCQSTYGMTTTQPIQPRNTPAVFRELRFDPTPRTV